MITQYMIASHVRSAGHGDRTILLDLRREQYYSLDEVGTRVWSMLQEGADVPTIVARIGEEFDAPIERITSDVNALLSQLASEWRVITPVAAAQPAAEPSGLYCAFALTLMTLSLRTLGLRRSIAVARRLTRQAARAAEPSGGYLERVVHKVDTAAAFFPGRALCLEQSLTLYLCLRRAGVMVDLFIGAQPYPFAAHAWVQYRDQLVGSSYDHVSKFIPFDRLAEAA